jgi:WD40 repeat protein
MGRPERSIDPEAGPVAEFARDLRRLRDSAGRPSYRELARRAGLSVTVLSEAAGGQRLPTLPVVKGYVGGCGGDLADWEQRWKRAIEQERERSADSARPAPYRGLASYGIEHAGVYFGREELTGELLERLRRGRFLAVFGPSGSGKSSLLRAGLLAAVQRGDAESLAGWESILLTPGEQPLGSLAGHVAALSGIPAQRVLDGLRAGPEGLSAPLARALEGRPAGAEVVLVVDQFEELFTICRDRADRDRFVHALLAAAASDDAPVRVVLGIRADFYAQCATWPGLVTALRDAQVLVGSMDHDQLRDVIAKPAQQAGATVERALVATAIAETGAEPGALALVSHALLETWRHSPSGRLTLAAYQQAGGVAHAIASTAERVYAGCGDDEQRLLRQILLRLVALGDGGPDTRRRVPRGQLADGSDPGADDLVERLVQARLITTDEGAVQLAHEALIRFWPRLGGWLAEDRETLQMQRRVADAASEWASYGRDPALLYRGTPLALAWAWAERDGHLTGLTSVEREFLGASSAAANRAARRYRVLLAALVILLAAVGGAGWTAAWQRESALSNANAAASGQLAVLSAALATGHPDAAVLAALAAWSAKPTLAARSALLSTIGCCSSAQASLPGSYAAGQAVALSPDGKLLAAGGKDTAVHVWDTADGRQIAVLRGSAGQVRALALSTGLIAAGYTGHRILLWNPARHVPERVLAGDTGTIEDLAFSPTGRLLASASDDGQVRLWNPATGHGEPLLPRPGKPMLSVAFSPDGGMLAIAGKGGAVTLWDISDAARPRAVHRLAGVAGTITKLAFSPRGTLLAGEQPDGGVLLWNLGRDTPPIRILHATVKDSRGLGFSRDDSILLTVSYHQLRLWDTRTGRLAVTDIRRIPGEAHALAYDPRTGTLAMAGGAGVIQLWLAPVPPFTGSTAPVTGLAAIPGEPLMTSVSDDDTLRLWRSDGSLAVPATLTGHPDAIAASPDGKLLATAVAGGAVTVRALPGLGQHLRLQTPDNATTVKASLAFSPDSRLLAASAGHAVTLWDAASGTLRRSFPVPAGIVDKITFSPGDGALAAVTSKGDVIMWTTRTGQDIAGVSASSAPLDAVAFSRAGRLLAVAGDDGNITVWDPRNLRRPLVFPGPGGPVHALAFSPDGHALAAAGTNDAITLRDTRNWSQIATLTSGDHSVVHALAFGPAGATLLSGEDSGRIIAWSLDPRAVIRADCQMLARDPGLSQAAAMVPRASYPRLCPPGGS